MPKTHTTDATRRVYSEGHYDTGKRAKRREKHVFLPFFRHFSRSSRGPVRSGAKFAFTFTGTDTMGKLTFGPFAPTCFSSSFSPLSDRAFLRSHPDRVSPTSSHPREREKRVKVGRLSSGISRHHSPFDSSLWHERRDVHAFSYVELFRASVHERIVGGISRSECLTLFVLLLS